jgi:hypothetical protein
MAGQRGLGKFRLREATRIGKAAAAAGSVVQALEAAPDGTVRAVIRQDGGRQEPAKPNAFDEAFNVTAPASVRS